MKKTAINKTTPIKKVATSTQADDRMSNRVPYEDLNAKIQAQMANGSTNDEAMDKVAAEGNSDPHAQCYACGKNKRIAVHHHGQALCYACNAMLRRRHGKKYAEVIDDPAAIIQAIYERKAETKDEAKIRKHHYTLVSIIEDLELEDEHKKKIYAAFRPVFDDLLEAQLLTFNTEKENVKS